MAKTDAARIAELEERIAMLTKTNEFNKNGMEDQRRLAERARAEREQALHTSVERERTLAQKLDALRRVLEAALALTDNGRRTQQDLIAEWQLRNG